ncbi:hypothetical protein [Arthrobacter sp. MMS24-S77]
MSDGDIRHEASRMEKRAAGCPAEGPDCVVFHGIVLHARCLITKVRQGTHATGVINGFQHLLRTTASTATAALTRSAMGLPLELKRQSDGEKAALTPVTW